MSKVEGRTFPQSDPGAPVPQVPQSGDDAELREWIRRAQGGDRDAFDLIMVRFQQRIYLRAIRRTRDDDEAADLTQDVLLTCFRKLHQFRGESQFWTWLSRIVDNLFKNRLAYKGRRGDGKTISLDTGRVREGEDEPEAIDPVDPGAGPFRKAAEAEAMGALDGCLARLSEDHREVLLLRFSDDLSYEEIAETLQIDLGTVKSRISRARKELRDLMKDHVSEL